jgi:hypothetical protein
LPYLVLALSLVAAHLAGRLSMAAKRPIQHLRHLRANGHVLANGSSGATL